MEHIILNVETARTVKAALAKAGMTQKVLAARLGVSRLTLWRILTGKRPVRARERRRIAAAIGIEIERLFLRRRRIRKQRATGLAK